MWEVLLILVVLLLVFGARRLPEIGAALGKGIREFKGSIKEIEGEINRPGGTQDIQAPHSPSTPRQAETPPPPDRGATPAEPVSSETEPSTPDREPGT